ncbi:MAG: hypothetical protein H7A53_11465 [Akkermansiaceae bacterium]|nr:hypothetical protein [Akkermansiaceae bacterium]MCP5551497.1 hypothetical protein [Akkermansiaceae bacterium]
MSSFRVRPHFRQIVESDATTVQEQIVARLSEAKCGCDVKNFPGYVTLRIPERFQHFWSPQLNISVEAGDDDKTVIQGIYGPNTNVWAMFLYGYLVIAFLGIAGAVIGFSQWMLDRSPWGFWISAVAGAAALILYFVAQTGQKLGAQQTFMLHQAYETAVGESVEIR